MKWLIFAALKILEVAAAFLVWCVLCCIGTILEPEWDFFTRGFPGFVISIFAVTISFAIGFAGSAWVKKNAEWAGKISESMKSK